LILLKKISLKLLSDCSVADCFGRMLTSSEKPSGIVLSNYVDCVFNLSSSTETTSGNA
jgi:hypothetical protein